MRIPIILLGFMFSISSYSQTNLDSLWAVWEDKTELDTNRLNALRQIFEFSVSEAEDKNFSLDSIQTIAQMQYDLAEQQKSKKHLLHAIGNLRYACVRNGDSKNAIEYSKQEINMARETNDKKMLGHFLLISSKIYIRDLIDPINGMKVLSEAREIAYELNDKQLISEVLFLFGVLLIDSDEAIEYYTQSLDLAIEIKDSTLMSGNHFNLGNIKGFKASLDPDTNPEKFNVAISHFEQALELDKKLGNKKSMAKTLFALAAIRLHWSDLDTIPKEYFECLKLMEEENDVIEMSFLNAVISERYLRIGNSVKALEYADRGYEIAISNSLSKEKMDNLRALINVHSATGEFEKAFEYSNVLHAYSDSLDNLAVDKTILEMEAKYNLEVEKNAHQEEVRQKNKTRNMLAAGGLLFFILAGGFYSRWRYVRRSRDIISKEKDRSNNLLLNILPADIAEELKIHGKAEARDFDMVSILFTDFKGFTEASAKLSAGELVSEINACFKAFDGICGKYEVEKIKTIGDAYMAAGGLPVPTDGSVKNTVLVALEMQDFISIRKEKLDSEGKPAFEMRVGIHTGPVVAGIVGVKKFQYDIWGDTVNTASRMESSGSVGQVNISQATYELLQDDLDFSFEKRGKIEAKGKGELEMYFVSKK